MPRGLMRCGRSPSPLSGRGPEYPRHGMYAVQLKFTVNDAIVSDALRLPSQYNLLPMPQVCKYHGNNDSLPQTRTIQDYFLYILHKTTDSVNLRRRRIRQRPICDIEKPVVQHQKHVSFQNLTIFAFGSEVFTFMLRVVSSSFSSKSSLPSKVYLSFFFLLLLLLSLSWQWEAINIL